MSDYIERIESGESPLKVFSTVGKYKKSLEDFLGKFKDISGIYVQPGVCFALYSANGYHMKVTNDRDVSMTSNMHRGGPREQALLSDMSDVRWMLKAFARAVEVPKKSFTLGYVNPDWHNRNTHT